jgi:predicted dehydrogenase
MVEPPPTWAGYYRGLARALAGEAEVPVSPSGASEVIRLIELIKHSAKLGRTLELWPPYQR